MPNIHSININSSIMRKMFATSLSTMFSKEVPEYDRFKQIVRESNEAFIHKNPHTILDPEHRVLSEKHGAIRVGTPAEMRIVTRIFSLFGMQPVGFYDLTTLPKPLPVIGTAFRPVDHSIQYSAFRMFCSMLHPSYINFDIEKVLSSNKRESKFSKNLRTLLDLLETYPDSNDLTYVLLQEFVTEVVNAFRINTLEPIFFPTYKTLRLKNDIFADIVCIGININHLTPRAYDISDATIRLERAGIPMKDGGIEGPPIRVGAVPVLLNQTSRKAPGEPLFVTNIGDIEGIRSDIVKNAPKIVMNVGETIDSYLDRIQNALSVAPIVEIEHKARFGEIEARGIALTAKGEALYNTLMSINRFVEDFPKTHTELFAEGLAYYRPGMIPITYEDFLATSAAGIFTSNLSVGTTYNANETNETINISNRGILEKAMNKKIIDHHELYRSMINE